MLRKLFNFFGRRTFKQENKQGNEKDWTDENSQFQNDFRERQSRIPEHMQEDENDYLGMAAATKQKAEEALENKKFDLAWGMEHERIQHYTNHALKQGFSASETFALLSTVYSSLSNILQLEGKHTLSLAFYLYAVQCDGNINEGVQANIRRICRLGKLKHFNRNIDDFLTGFVSKDKVTQSNLSFCQNEVTRWQSEAPYHSDNIQEMIKHYISTPGYLSLVSGVSKNIENALLESNIETIEALLATDQEELIKIKGVGKTTLLKINNSIEFMQK
jgi:hypothetical protein